MIELTPSKESSVPEPLKCMDVWGGNRSVSEKMAVPGLDVWVVSQPSAQDHAISSDLHFLSSCASGRITRMLLADLCGHHSVFTSLAAQLKRLMKRNINCIEQVRFIRDMHEQLKSYSEQGGYATALISTYFAPRKSFTLCNAGHASPFVYRAKAKTWSVIKQCPKTTVTSIELPMEVLDHLEYQQFHTRLQEGDMVLSYGNNLAECRDAHGKTLGVNGLFRLVQQASYANPSDLLSSVIGGIRQWNAPTLEDKDTTMLLCRATNRSVGWKDNLLAPFRLFGKVGDNTEFH